MHPDSTNIVLTGGRGPSEWTDMDFAVSWSRSYGDSTSWVRCELADTGFCYAVEFAPSNSSIVYAAGQVTRSGTIFRSTDIGLTWTKRLSAPRDSILSIAIHPQDPGIVLRQPTSFSVLRMPARPGTRSNFLSAMTSSGLSGSNRARPTPSWPQG